MCLQTPGPEAQPLSLMEGKALVTMVTAAGCYGDQQLRFSPINTSRLIRAGAERGSGDPSDSIARVGRQGEARKWPASVDLVIFSVPRSLPRNGGSLRWEYLSIWKQLPKGATSPLMSRLACHTPSRPARFTKIQRKGELFSVQKGSYTSPPTRRVIRMQHFVMFIRESRGHAVQMGSPISTYYLHPEEFLYEDIQYTTPYICNPHPLTIPMRRQSLKAVLRLYLLLFPLPQ